MKYLKEIKEEIKSAVLGLDFTADEDTIGLFKCDNFKVFLVDNLVSIYYGEDKDRHDINCHYWDDKELMDKFLGCLSRV